MKEFTLSPKKSLSLNEFLRSELPRLLDCEISNSKIRRLIVVGKVDVNGVQTRFPAFVVRPSFSVTVQIDEEKLFFEKQNGDIDFELSEKDILFEDESIIVVNKPAHFPSEAGMVQSRDNLHAAVVRFLFARQKIEKPNAKNPPYVGIMHRLDRDTSGVILFTKTRAVNAKCHEMFENHSARKIYHAIVLNADKTDVTNTPDRKMKKSVPSAQSVPFASKKTSASSCTHPHQEFTVDFSLGRISPKSQAAKWGRVSEKNGGLPSKTEFTVLREIAPNELHSISGRQDAIQISAKKFFLVECRPFTGRTHQIRVHLSSVGLPILGDTLYGGEPYERIMLHAASLTFPHPVTGEVITITAKSPF